MHICKLIAIIHTTNMKTRICNKAKIIVKIQTIIVKSNIGVELTKQT
jgi:hypothetical protein